MAVFPAEVVKSPSLLTKVKAPLVNESLLACSRTAHWIRHVFKTCLLRGWRFNHLSGFQYEQSGDEPFVPRSAIVVFIRRPMSAELCTRFC
jgi:hypothetical protein